mmetsp:Transcript_30967/g.52017  ORF Transcript_30967/g.52017 Transcript_30967/m.52017 type:complete len:208 (+) Transcript_30967:295-918(+)
MLAVNTFKPIHTNNYFYLTYFLRRLSNERPRGRLSSVVNGCRPGLAVHLFQCFDSISFANVKTTPASSPTLMLRMLSIVVGTLKKTRPAMAVGILFSDPVMLYVVGEVSLRNQSDEKLIPKLTIPERVAATLNVVELASISVNTSGTSPKAIATTAISGIERRLLMYAIENWSRGRPLLVTLETVFITLRRYNEYAAVKKQFSICQL